MKRGFVEVAGKSLLRNDELPARQDLDVRKIFHALFDEFDSVRERKFAFVLLDDENIKFRDTRRRVFDEVQVTEREGIAIHDERADLNFLFT